MEKHLKELYCIHTGNHSITGFVYDKKEAEKQLKKLIDNGDKAEIITLEDAYLGDYLVSSCNYAQRLA